MLVSPTQHRLTDMSDSNMSSSLLLVMSLFGLCEINNAAVTLPSFFSSRMVLQAGPVQKAQIFGTTDDPDTDIEVEMSCFNCCNGYGPYRADIVSI